MIVPEYVHLKLSLTNLAYSPLDESIPIKVILLIIVIVTSLPLRCLRGWLCRVLPSLHCAVLARFMQAKCALDFSPARFETGKANLVLVNFTLRVGCLSERENLIFFVEKMPFSV